MATEAPRPAAPTPNDEAAVQSDTPPHPTGRQANGRFARGNRGAPGNPFARRVAELRCAFIGAVTPEDLQQICRRLVTMAAMGDLAAAKLVVGYVLGRVPDPVDPDTLDQQECRQYQQNMSCVEIGQVVQHQPPADMAAGILRCNEIANAERGHQLAQQIRAEDAQLEQERSAAAADSEDLEADDEAPEAAETRAVSKAGQRRPAAARRQPTVPSASAASAVVLAPQEASGVASAPRVRTEPAPSANGGNGRDRAPAPSTIGPLRAADGRAS